MFSFEIYALLNNISYVTSSSPLVSIAIYLNALRWIFHLIGRWSSVEVIRIWYHMSQPLSNELTRMFLNWKCVQEKMLVRISRVSMSTRSCRNFSQRLLLTTGYTASSTSSASTEHKKKRQIPNVVKLTFLVIRDKIAKWKMEVGKFLLAFFFFSVESTCSIRISLSTTSLTPPFDLESINITSWRLGTMQQHDTVWLTPNWFAIRMSSGWGGNLMFIKLSSSWWIFHGRKQKRLDTAQTMGISLSPSSQSSIATSFNYIAPCAYDTYIEFMLWHYMLGYFPNSIIEANSFGRYGKSNESPRGTIPEYFRSTIAARSLMNYLRQFNQQRITWNWEEN